MAKPDNKPVLMVADAANCRILPHNRSCRERLPGRFSAHDRATIRSRTEETMPLSRLFPANFRLFRAQSRAALPCSPSSRPSISCRSPESPLQSQARFRPVVASMGRRRRVARAPAPFAGTVWEKYFAIPVNDRERQGTTADDKGRWHRFRHSCAGLHRSPSLIQGSPTTASRWDTPHVQP